jgi:hypothetical protein
LVVAISSARNQFAGRQLPITNVEDRVRVRDALLGLVKVQNDAHSSMHAAADKNRVDILCGECQYLKKYTESQSLAFFNALALLCP